MRVVISKAFGPYSVGHVLSDVAENQARTWIDRGLAREEKAMSSPADRMMRPAGDQLHRVTKRTGR